MGEGRSFGPCLGKTAEKGESPPPTLLIATIFHVYFVTDAAVPVSPFPPLGLSRRELSIRLSQWSRRRYARDRTGRLQFRDT